MKTLVVYYSLSGKTKKMCEKYVVDVKKKGADVDLIEILEVKKRSTVSAYLVGAPMALKHQASEIQKTNIDISLYDNVIIAGPIWASNAPPAINAFLREYDLKSKNVTGVLTYAGGAGKAPDNFKTEIENVGAICKTVVALSPKELDNLSKMID